MKLFSSRTLEYILLAPFVLLLLLVFAVFVQYWLEDRPQQGIPAHIHDGLSVQVDGFPRSFSAYLPGDAPKGQPMPLVIVLHTHVAGVDAMLGRGLVPMAETVWMRVAEREKFILLYPQGLIARDGKSGWNDCRIASPANPVVNDTKFIAALIDYAQHKFNLDPGRVYIAGWSNGGFMALRAAQELSGRVTAVAANAALMVRKTECHDKPEKPVSVLFMYGSEDWITPENGGEMPGGRGTLYSAEESMALWAKWNGLDGVAPETSDVPDTAPDDNVTATYTRIALPDHPVAVAAYRFAGQGHAAPSKVMKQPWWMDAMFGWQNHDVEMAEAMWDFFKDKRR